MEKQKNRAQTARRLLELSGPKKVRVNMPYRKQKGCNMKLVSPAKTCLELHHGSLLKGFLM